MCTTTALAKQVKLPRVYAIVDADALRGRGIALKDYAEALHAEGVRMVQYRDKSAGAREILGAVAVLRGAMPDAVLILNDRADLAVLSGCDGVHVGQGDLSVADARVVMGAGMVGVSTHNAVQVRAADLSVADYVAVGPVFATGSKADAEAVVGLEFVRVARGMTTKPLVAIGGITAKNAVSVLAAGANCVAVISALLPEGGETVRESVRRFVDAIC